MIIAVDFDGTIVNHDFPKIGKEKPFAFDTLRQLIADGNKLILWTVREGELLDDAVRFCRENGVEFYAVNSTVPDDALFPKGSSSRKIDVDCYIDDRNLGGLPEWGDIYEMISAKRLESRSKHSNHHGLLYRMFHRH